LSWLFFLAVLAQVVKMVEKLSQVIGRDAQLATPLRHKWQAEIERAVDKVKLGVVPTRKRTKTEKWFRRQWCRARARDRRAGMQFSCSRTPSAKL